MRTQAGIPGGNATMILPLQNLVFGQVRAGCWVLWRSLLRVAIQVIGI